MIYLDNYGLQNFCWMNIYKIVVMDAVAQSVECTTPCEDAIGSIPAVATRSLLVGSLSLEVTGWGRIHGLPALSRVAALKIVRHQSWNQSAI